MLIGAGAGANIILKEIESSQYLNLSVKCIIDDQKGCHGKLMRGVPIVGGREKIAEAVDEYSIDVFCECVTKAKSENKIIMIATHIAYALNKCCDKMYELKDGCLFEYMPTVKEYKITFVSPGNAQEAANKIKENVHLLTIDDAIIVSVENDEILEVIKRVYDYNIISVERKTI
jgi:hypothetical protein